MIYYTKILKKSSFFVIVFDLKAHFNNTRPPLMLTILPKFAIIKVSTYIFFLLCDFLSNIFFVHVYMDERGINMRLVSQ